jgi:hypothetical protein
MLSNLSEGMSPVGPITFREKFEGATGIDCSPFFRGGRFQAAAAIAILEEFVSSKRSRDFREGVRYFFGHAIPEQ